jgi:hypothetical protein
MENFVNRLNQRLARYELLLKGTTEVIDVVKSSSKETQPGVASAEHKVDLLQYNLNLVFKTGETVVSRNPLH